MFKIKGERVILTEFTEEDIENLMTLWNNGEVTKYVGFPMGLHKSREDILEWLNVNYPMTTLTNGNFRLKVTNRDGVFMGEAAINKMNDDFQSDLDIKLLPQFWGKGYGTEIMKMLIDYAFTQTPIKVLALTPNVKNEGALRLYKKLGFEDVKPIGYAEKLDNPIMDKIFESMYYHTMKLERESYISD